MIAKGHETVQLYITIICKRIVEINKLVYKRYAAFIVHFMYEKENESRANRILIRATTISSYEILNTDIVWIDFEPPPPLPFTSTPCPPPYFLSCHFLHLYPSLNKKCHFLMISYII